MKRPMVHFMLLWDCSSRHRWRRGSHWGALFVSVVSQRLFVAAEEEECDGPSQTSSELTRVSALLLLPTPLCVWVCVRFCCLHVCEEVECVFVCVCSRCSGSFWLQKAAAAVLLMKTSYTLLLVAGEHVHNDAVSHQQSRNTQTLTVEQFVRHIYKLQTTTMHIYTNSDTTFKRRGLLLWELILFFRL